MTGASVPVHTLLPTTIVGSLPKPSWLAEPEVLWSPWALEGDALDEGKHDALRIVVAISERIVGFRAGETHGFDFREIVCSHCLSPQKFRFSGRKLRPRSPSKFRRRKGYLRLKPGFRVWHQNIIMPPG